MKPYISSEDIRKYFLSEKVCFVTNGNTTPGSLLWKSMKTWIDLTDTNVLVIPGQTPDDRPFYGRVAFMYMLDVCLKKGYDYIIYLDEDFFLDIKNNGENALYDYFRRFADGDEYCIAGMPDGGMVCHRNHNRVMVNTFVSFWNLKLIRQAKPDLDFLGVRLLGVKVPFDDFIKNNPELYRSMLELSSNMIIEGKLYREVVFKADEDYESPYCATVRNDPNNSIEPNQIPYSSKMDSFEPYYSVQQAICQLTQKPIMYMLGVDAYFPKSLEKENFGDQSGITTAMIDADGEPWGYHTWFARGWGKNKFHTNRIESVFASIVNF